MTADVPDRPKGTVQIHNVRFYTIKPRTIISLAYNKLQKLLALSREQGSIELWDMRYAPFLDRVIPLAAEAQVEALSWAGKRLFSVGLTGALVEWDLCTLQPRHEHSPTGNALWCLDINAKETELAVGSEEGHINIMNIEHGEISYKSLFQKKKGRVLCCKFDKSGQYLVTGSLGAVRIWNSSKGNVLHTMTLSTPKVIVWSLQVLSDFTIISGDSAGYVTVWNGNNATQVEACKVMDSNVFTLAINEEENRLVCSGMYPPLIRVLAKTQIKRDESLCDRWVKFLQRDVHNHYVKTVVLMDDHIISGGEDGMLCISSSTRTQATMAKYAPFLQGGCATLANASNQLLLRYPNALQLWRLGQAKQTSINESAAATRENLLVECMPEKLLQLNVGKSKLLLAAAISPDGSWLCYSTAGDIYLYYVQAASENEPMSTKHLTENLPPELQPATHIIFTKASESIFLLHAATRQLRCFNLQEQLIKFAYSIDLSQEISAHINQLLISQCGRYIVAASVNHSIAVWQLKNGKHYKHLLNLPRCKAACTALALHDDLPLLVVAYADGRIKEYDLVERCFTCEADKQFVDNSNTHCIRGIVLVAQNPNIIIVYNEVFLYVLEKFDKATDETAPEGKAKRPREPSRALDETQLQGLRLKIQFNREHLAQVVRLGPNKLVTVGVQARHLMALLPEPHSRKKFGVS